MKFSIRLLYLYLFSFIGLLIAVIGSVRLVQLGIKVYVFNGADQYRMYDAPITPEGKVLTETEEERVAMVKANEEENQRQRQREVSEALAMLIVGIPLYKYHWNIIKKENKKN
jgi:hypothetical protein